MDIRIDLVITAVLSFAAALITAALGQRRHIETLIHKSVERESERLSEEIAFWRSKYAESVREIHKLEYELAMIRSELETIKARLSQYEGGV